jgi:ADP-dependent NAD(P)H-hydrate dehydratase / NAD(P)H-hydrate epimerase
MIPLLSVAQAKELDERTQKEFHISSQVLMKTAGEKSAFLFSQFYPDKKQKISVLCGSGNNAGDGVVMGLTLSRLGYKNIKYYMMFPRDLWGEPLKQLMRQVPSSQVRLSGVKSFTEISKRDRVIDAVFGIGLSRDVEGELAQLFNALNEQNLPTIAIDVASGLNADTGELMGVALCSERTFTFGWAKPGQFIRHGAEYSGSITRLDIGFPVELSDEIAKNYFLIRRKDVRALLPVRTRLGNKTNYGKVKIWAGSPGFLGARVLASRGAFRAGAGYVIIESEEENPLALEFIPEAMTKKPEPATDTFTYAVGPGLGVNESTKKKIEELYNNEVKSVVLDADALTVIAQYQLPTRPSWILTPHTGELSRLLGGISSATIEKNRVLYAQKAAKKYSCVVLLKGYRSLVAEGEQVYIVPTGNSALAKAGSGDVLTGLISGLRAQGLSPRDAAIGGAYVHGAVADRWIRANDIRGLTPSDLLVEIPRVMKKICSPSR